MPIPQKKSLEQDFQQLNKRLDQTPILRFCEHQIKAKYKEAKIIPCYPWEKKEFFGCNTNPQNLYECPYKNLKNNNCSDLMPLINYTNLSEHL